MTAEDGLDALGNPCVDGNDHQGEIGNNPVGSYPGVSLEGKDDGVQHDDDDTRGQLRNQGRGPT